MREQLRPAGSRNKNSKQWGEQEWKYVYERLRRRCARWLNGDMAAVDDLVSQTTIKLFCLDDAIVLDNPYAWMSRTAWNQFIDDIRYRKRQRQLCERLASESCTHISSVISTEEQLLHEELLGRVDAVLDTLPAGQQRAFRLHIMEGKDYPEVAACLAISQPNARKRVQLARAAIREQLQAYLVG